VFGYLAQVRCDPEATETYFSRLFGVVDLAGAFSEYVPEEVQELVLFERARGRFTADELTQALSALGFGDDNELRVEYEPDTDDEFVGRAYTSALSRARRVENSARVKDLHDAFRIVAIHKRSRALVVLGERQRAMIGMSVRQAYDALQATQEMDEGSLITVYGISVRDPKLLLTHSRVMR
jgi:ubiquitin carboxyl-terminal hydrolase 25